MLNSLDLPRILVFKTLHPEQKTVEFDGVVDVFDGSYKREEEEHQVLECFKIVSTVFAS